MAFAQGRPLLRQKDVDMTTGSVVMHLIRFAFPLLIGNLFQQLYNTVDTWVVGNFVGDNAFAAVGSMGPIVNMFIGFFLGFSAGAGALISQNFGAKNEEAIEKRFDTYEKQTKPLIKYYKDKNLLFVVQGKDTPEQTFDEIRKVLS